MAGLLHLPILYSILCGFSHSSDTPFPIPRDSCQIENINGFLQYVCSSSDTDNINNNITGCGENCPFHKMALFRCINSDQYYRVSLTFFSRLPYATVNILCDNDPNFYQACAARTALLSFVTYDHFGAASISGRFPCGFLCSENKIKTRITLRNYGECGADNDCLNRALIQNDQTYCPADAGNKKCDMVCDTRDCEDESFCNGLSYGLWCDNHTTYAPPLKICDGYMDCEDEMDESICKVDPENKTLDSCRLNNLNFDNPKIPLFNFTRCRPLTHYEFKNVLFHYCIDYLDQTNCSDGTRVGLYCPINGYLSTVSKEVICSTAKHHITIAQRLVIPPVCDDSLDKACIDASYSCNVHKHQLCDGQSDCQDNGDEKHLYCQHMADQQCVRRFIHGGLEQYVNLSIPMDWVHDGISDCLYGEDENEFWPTCGRDRTLRYKDQINSSCSEVFLCTDSEKFIVFSRLCDRVDSCGNENQICEKSRDHTVTQQKALRDDKGIPVLLYCHNGLKSVLELKNDSCKVKPFVHSERKIFGKNKSLDISLPQAQQDCGFLYGESYVFLSCLQMCRSSRCPIESMKNVSFHSCPGPGRLAKDTVFSVDDRGDLALLLRNPKTRFLSDDIFVCKDSQKCLTYDKLCNLVDDCGDGSDEASCDNHFQCETSKELISLNQKCDQILHCQDFSDECNDSCGKTIIDGGIGLKVMAWLIGVLAIVFNFYALVINSSACIHTCRSEAAFITNSLMILISFGDFLVGVHLAVLAFFDAYYGSKHCVTQTEWLTSNACVSLGVINFFGSEISLFSMTVLSAIRAMGSVQSDFSVPKERTRKSLVKVISLFFIIILICFMISYWPLLKSYEDYFVNGIRYEASNTLLIGCPGKEKHYPILDELAGTRGLRSRFSLAFFIEIKKKACPS